MVAEPLTIEFHQDARSPVVTRMVVMAGARKGWVNFTPGLDVDVPPPDRSAMSALFGNKGPEVPLATWSPGDGRREPATVGIQHAQGPRVLAQLSDQGIELPEQWRKLQDHPKRGLVCALPQSGNAEQLDETVAWLLGATGKLCRVRRTGEWRALCFLAI
jgi:hypothetical protein